MKAEETSLSESELKRRIDILAGKISCSRYEKLKRAAHFRTRQITLVLEDIFQPHNGAAVLRTADAFGLKEVHAIENRYRFKVSHQVDMGASKWLDIFKYTHSGLNAGQKIPKRSPLPEDCQKNALEAFEKIRERGYILAASVPGECAYTPQTLPIDKPVAVMIGTELTGLSDEAIQSADIKFSVPMYGMAQSMNLSVFAGVCLEGISCRIRARDRKFWALGEREELELLLSWLKKCVRDADALLYLD